MIERHPMIIVIAAEGDIELVETEAISFLSVALGLLDLADDPVVHALPPCIPNRIKIKARERKQTLRAFYRLTFVAISEPRRIKPFSLPRNVIRSIGRVFARVNCRFPCSGGDDYPNLTRQNRGYRKTPIQAL